MADVSRSRGHRLCQQRSANGHSQPGTKAATRRLTALELQFAANLAAALC
jgi:hypothetical protein